MEKNGVVVSDLHMFAKRSQGHLVVHELADTLARSDLFVLNGDIFDFRWTTLHSVDDTIEQAVTWLEGLAMGFPACQIHFVVGNHDCYREFVSGLSEMEQRCVNFNFHERYLFMGDSVFLHGDCVHKNVLSNGLASYRKPWKTVKKKGRAQSALYEAINQSRIPSTAPKLVFRKEKMADRILDYLQDREPELTHLVNQVYVGHTHAPFTDFQHRGRTFHNTGSAVKNHQFNSLNFSVLSDENSPAKVSSTSYRVVAR